MGTITTTVIATKCATILNDVTGVRWPLSTELLMWINEGQRAVVLLKPDAGAKRIAVKLPSGARQALPSDCLLLMDITCNLGTDGVTPGRAVRLVSGEVIDAVMPGWRASTASDVARNYTYDPKYPKQFHVYPPAGGSGYVEMVYSAMPADVGYGSPITIDDAYEIPLVEWVLYRALCKDAEHGETSAFLISHLNAFTQALTGKTASELNFNPNVAIQPFNPTVTGTAKI